MTFISIQPIFIKTTYFIISKALLPLGAGLVAGLRAPQLAGPVQAPKQEHRHAQAHAATGLAHSERLRASVNPAATVRLHSFIIHHFISLIRPLSSAVAGYWGSWSGWSACSPTCGTGTGSQSNTQTCLGTCASATCTPGVTNTIYQSCSNGM